MRLYLRCKKCGEKFFTFLDLPIPDAELRGTHKCPRGQATDNYEGGDYMAEEKD
jgi:hypothetical protein